MSNFQEDMIFKNINEEDARTFLEIIGIKSKKVKIMTQELRQLDPTAFIPDMILELDDKILLVEFQSVVVTKIHSKRFLVYIALADYKFDKMGKPVELCVFSTAEESKKIIHHINDDNDFVYDVISLKNYDSNKIINNINDKIINNEKITAKEIILFALVPLIEKSGNVEDYIDVVVDTLFSIKGLTHSIQSLVFGIEGLIVDKFVTDELKRNLLCDRLGGRMSLLDEYGRLKERRGHRQGLRQGIRRGVGYGLKRGLRQGRSQGRRQGVEQNQEFMIKNLLRAGHSPEAISKDTLTPLSRVNAVKKKYNL